MVPMLVIASVTLDAADMMAGALSSDKVGKEQLVVW